MCLLCKHVRLTCVFNKLMMTMMMMMMMMMMWHPVQLVIIIVTISIHRGILFYHQCVSKMSARFSFMTFYELEPIFIILGPQ